MEKVELIIVLSLMVLVLAALARHINQNCPYSDMGTLETFCIVGCLAMSTLKKLSSSDNAYVYLLV